MIRFSNLLVLLLFPLTTEASTSFSVSRNMDCEYPATNFEIKNAHCHSSANFVELSDNQQKNDGSVCSTGQQMTLEGSMKTSEPVYSSMRVQIDVRQLLDDSTPWWKTVRKSYSATLNLLPYSGNANDMWLEAGEHSFTANFQVPTGLSYMFKAEGDQALVSLLISPSKTYNSNYGQFLTRQFECTTTLEAVSYEEAVASNYAAIAGIVGVLLAAAFVGINGRRRCVTADEAAQSRRAALV